MELLERDDQLAVLGEAARQAAAGRGRVVLVEGEAGLGKTSLLTRFAADIAGGAPVLWGRCDDLSIPRPLAPVIELLGDTGGDPDAISPGWLREQLLDRLAGGRPMTALVLEDIHWADEATLDLITVIGRRIRGLPALLVLSFRGGETSMSHPVWSSLGALSAEPVDHLRLTPLSRDAVGRLSGPDADRVYTLTGGNPFYVTELLSSGDGRLPPSVANAVLGRAARLGEDARHLVELVAMVPTQIASELLDALMPGWLAAADEPERRGLLQITTGHVAFRHELARAAIRSGVPVARRRRLHAEILAALRSRGPDPAEAIHHAEEAGDLDAVAELAPDAAHRAAAVASNREAYAHLARAIELAERYAPTRRAELYEELASAAYLVDRLDEAIPAIEQATALRRELSDQLGLGRCLRRSSRFHWYAGDGLAAGRFAHAALETLAPLGETVELATTYGTLGQLAMLANRLDEATSWAERAVTLATRLGDDHTRVHALVTLGITRSPTDPDDTEPLDEAFREADRAGEPHEATRALLGLVDRSFVWVRASQAWTTTERARAYAAEHEVDTLHAFLTAHAGWQLVRLGDWEDADELLTHQADRGSSVTLLLVATAAAELALRRGDRDAPDRLNEVTALAERTGELQWLGPVLELAMEWALLHDLPLPVDRVRAARREVDPDTWAAVGYGARLTGWLTVAAEPETFTAPTPAPHRAMARGDWAGAAAAFADAGWDYDRALMLSLLDDEDALSEGLAVCWRLGARPLEERIGRRMRGLGYRVPRGPTTATRANAARLTPRELEVARLLADDLTNAEIAGRLHLSPRTAEHHVSAVMSKLGVRTRRDAAVRAGEIGLLDPA